MKTNRLTWSQFAGIDTDTHPLRPPTDELGKLSADVATNCIIDQASGEVRNSPGSSLYHAAACTGGPIIGLGHYVGTAGERTLIARTATGYYKSNPGRTTWTQLLATATVGESLAVPSFAQIGGWLAVVDGFGAWLWDGIAANLQAWRAADLEAPKYTSTGTQKPTFAITSGSVLVRNKSYEVFYCFVDSAGVVGPPGRVLVARSTSFNLGLTYYTGYADTGVGLAADGVRGSGHGRWTLPTGVVKAQLYMSDADTPGVWYPIASAAGGEYTVGTAADGTEITFTLSALTKASTTALAAFIGPPAGVNVACAHIERLFVAGSPQFPNRLWWTEAGGVNFASSSWIGIGKPDDPIISLVSFPTGTPTLGILCRNSVWTLSGSTDEDMAVGLRQIASGPGCLAPHAVAMVNGVCYFWGSAGPFKFDGVTVESIATGISGQFAEAIRGN